MPYKFVFFDMWPYLIIAFIFVFCYLSKLKKSSEIIFISLFLFSALRYDLGWDYTMYVSDFKEGYSQIIDSRYELLSKLIILLAIIVDFYPLLFIIFAWLILKLTFLSINKYSINPVISWLVYYSMPLFFFASLSTLRQSLATVIILYSYKYIIQKRYFHFIVAIIIASLFHISGIIGILILPLMLIPINKRINYILIIVSFFISTLIKNISSNYFSEISIFIRFFKYYIDATNAGPTSLQYLYYAIGIFNLIFYNKLVKLNTLNKYYISISSFGIVIFNILSFEPVSALRLSSFFLIFWIYLIPYYSLIFSKKYNRIIQILILILFLSLSFYYLFMYVNAFENKILEKVSFLPYKFWWDNL